MVKVLVCVAWPYANSPLHLGHVAGSLLPPDIFAKYHAMKGNEVLMVSGSDMHGTPITVRAEKEKTTPREVAERYHKMNKKAIEDLGINFSLFTKTTTRNHFEVVHDVFNKLMEHGYLYRHGAMQYYCPKCTKFLPDRYVEGRCKKCGDERARGDQCEKCGATYEAGELGNPRCTVCGTTPELRETDHYFLKLSAFQQPLIRWVKDKDYWRPNVKLFTQNWLEAGLKDRAITRDMSWGVTVPVPGMNDKVIYVWFEAVIGYLSASKEYSKIIGKPDYWREFWEDPEVRSYYFIGKDNIPFHTIIWPAMLMGYGGLNLPYDVPANEFLNFQGEKFSKSRGIGIDVQDILKQFDADVVRYFLGANMPEQRDADFNWEEFETKVNNELVATYGNYVHRVLSFTQKNFGEIPELQLKDTEKERKEVYDAIILAKTEVDLYLSTCQFKRALKSIMDLAQFGNRFFDSVAPWALMKSDKAKCGSVLNLNMEIVKALAALSWPYLPNSAQKVWKMLGNEAPLGQGSWTLIDVVLQPGTKLEEPKPLFSKVVLEKEPVNPFVSMSKLNLRVAKVISVIDHPNAERLFVVQLDAGKPVQLVAGLRAHYTKEQLTGKMVVYISNLEPAKLRGVESNGMMLAAESDGKVLVLTPSGDVEPGDPVDSGMGQSDKSISFEEFKKFTIKVGSVENGNVDLGGRKVPVKLPEKAEVPAQAAVLLPSPDAKEALALATAKGVVITVDGEIGNGAGVK